MSSKGKRKRVLGRRSDRGGPKDPAVPSGERKAEDKFHGKEKVQAYENNEFQKEEEEEEEEQDDGGGDDDEEDEDDDDEEEDGNDDDGRGGIPLTGTMRENDEMGSDDDDDEENEDEDEDEEGERIGPSKKRTTTTAEEHLDITFEFQDPAADHYHAIKTMLRDFMLPYGRVDISQLSDKIVGKPEIGTVIVQEEGTDIFAFITALNLGPHRKVFYFFVRLHSLSKVLTV